MRHREFLPSKVRILVIALSVLPVALSFAGQSPGSIFRDVAVGLELAQAGTITPDKPGASTPSTSLSAQQERDHLLMLAALSYTYASLTDRPPEGYDISALIAWNVQDLNKTPDFIIDRNRNYEKQGEVFHAEANVIRTAYDKMRDFNIAPSLAGSERYLRYTNDLKNATLYTTLEPCPMCETTITMAKIPLAIFCMEDPGLREAVTPHDTKPDLKVPTKFYGRELVEKHSDLADCSQADVSMWKTVEGGAPGSFQITSYIHQNSEKIFRPAWDELACSKSKYPENSQLLIELQKATGAISCTRP